MFRKTVFHLCSEHETSMIKTVDCESSTVDLGRSILDKNKCFTWIQGPYTKSCPILRCFAEFLLSLGSVYGRGDSPPFHAGDHQISDTHYMGVYGNLGFGILEFFSDFKLGFHTFEIGILKTPYENGIL